MRILKGYSKAEQKGLEYSKGNMSCNDFLHNITYFPACTECDSIKDKYDKANTDGRISIIRDILDFYTDKAKFAEQKYVVHDSVTDQYIYCNVLAKEDLRWWKLGAETAERKTKDEWLEISPAYEPMLEKV